MPVKSCPASQWVLASMGKASRSLALSQHRSLLTLRASKTLIEAADAAGWMKPKFLAKKDMNRQEALWASIKKERLKT